MMQRIQLSSSVDDRKGGCGCKSRTASHGACPACKEREKRGVPRTQVSEPGDRFEAEADRMADRAIAAGVPAGPPPPKAAASTSLRSASQAPEAIRAALADGGRALDATQSDAFGRRLGFDFASVRIHDGQAAAASAARLSARAYTFGQHVVFGAGQYRPSTAKGRRLLVHELVHVMQQTGAPGSHAAATRGPEQAGDEEQTRSFTSAVSLGVLARTPLVQRDFAIEPPHPAAEGVVLTEDQMREAIEFNDRVVSVIGADGIAELRDVLGVSADQAVVDEDFVNAVVRWQAVQGLPQDGKLGPRSARPLFREIGAEGVGRGEVETGPSYTPTGTITPPVVGGAQTATFRMRARFRHDPANAIYASCCEVRQQIRWDAAYAAARLGGIPHAGFPAGTAADTWIEDRDATGNRYGHRSGPHSDPQPFDQYLDTHSRRNQAFGHIYRGSDSPRSTAHAGSWRFRLRVIDVCNGNAVIGGQAFVRINWA